MAKGKRGAEQEAPKPKRVRAPLDPVVKECHTVAEALRCADLPPVIKEVLVAVIPNALAKRQDERHDFQEQMVQTIGNTLQGVEAGIQNQLAEAERGVQEAEKKAEELKQEQAVAEDAAKATFELSLEKKKALAQAAMKFRVAKRALAEARQTQEEGFKEVKKFTLDCEVLNSAMTRFEPLKNWTLEPAKSKEEAEHLLSSIKGRLELDETMSAALPSALVTPISERSSFTTMVVHQFGDILKARIEDLGDRCKAEESSKEALTAAVFAAEKDVEIAAGQQMEAADVFSAENDAYGAKMKVVQDLKKAVRESSWTNFRRALSRPSRSSSVENKKRQNTL